MADGTRTVGTASDTSEGGDDSNLYKLLSGTITDKDIDWSKISFLRSYAFRNCPNLTKIENPTLSNLADRGFQYCTNIKNAEITCADYSQVSCTALFSGCTELLTAKLNFINQNYDDTFGSSYVFENCTKLNTVILSHDSPKILRLRANLMFYKCTALRTLVLKTRNIVVLESGQNADS